MRPELHALVADELAVPVDPRIVRVAEAIVVRHGAAARAVLFYGSCLREAALDGLMLDFYLIVSDYADAYPTRWEAAANRLLPPNVYPFEAGGLAAKYAVLSAADFHRLCGPETDNPSVWARFAQPSRLVWAADARARDAAVAAVARAAPTLFVRTLPLVDPACDDPLATWRAAFSLTYAAELRPEGRARADGIVDADPARYRRFSSPARAAALAACPGWSREEAERRWRRTQRRGKRLTVARLVKASATYAGGIDYLAWKINRHARAGIAIRPWQRRWPVVGALSLLPRLLARGVVR